MHNFDLGAVLADAQRKEALTDWGPGEFEQPLTVLLDDYPGAGLNAIGEHILRSGIVHSLRMRLRAQEWMRRHPEILEETITAPIVVVGMMRSGTTLLQRLLAADPRLHCARGWEVVEAAPKLDYDFTGDDPRIAVSEAREAKSRELAPELFAIHPMYAREAEEEIVFLADTFLSHVPESGAHLPKYRSWLDAQDFAPAYTYLHRMLQVPAVAETAARTDRTTLGVEVAGAPGLSGRAARRVPRPPCRAHAPRPAHHDCVGRQSERHPARDACRQRRQAPGGGAVAGADGLDQ